MNNEMRDRVIEIVRDVYDRQAQVCDSADEIIELVEAALTQQQEAEPYGYLRENDGAIQISIGSERPADRSGGYATPWAAIYAHPPKPAAQPQVPPIWVLTREINEYDQDGAYFEHAWTHKPTAQEVAAVCEYATDSPVVKHILSGGGRQGIENVWYHLERFDQTAEKEEGE